MAALFQPLQDLAGPAWPLLWLLLKIIGIILPLLLCVAYLTFFERKVIGWIQVRIGPNRVGPWGLLQPIADGLKLVFKEIILPTKASKVLYFIGPAMAFATALAAWAVVPFSEGWVVANIDAGVLYLLAMTSIGCLLYTSPSPRD